MVGRDQKINSYGHGHGHGHADDDKEMPAVRSFHGSMCCKCAAGFTADCAAVCCCPLALLHLAAMALIRLPSAMAWKMIVNLKKEEQRKRQARKKVKEKVKVLAPILIPNLLMMMVMMMMMMMVMMTLQGLHGPEVPLLLRTLSAGPSVLLSNFIRISTIAMASSL
jgi:hypothetical protein